VTGAAVPSEAEPRRLRKGPVTERHSRRQLLANAVIAASRVGSYASAEPAALTRIGATPHFSLILGISGGRFRARIGP
jgi:hypothetical protein